MRRSRLLVLLAAFVALVPATAAHAVGAYGGVVAVATSGCHGFVQGTGSDGKTRGFTSCTGGTRFVQGAGSSWSSAAVNIGTPLAVAVAGTTTYVVYSAGGGTYLRSRTSTGTFSGAHRLTTNRSPYGIALAASAGQWWAVWGEPTNGGGFYLSEAHTLLGGTGTTHRAYGTTTQQYTDGYPALGYVAATKTMVIAWTHGASQGSFTVVKATSKGGAWSAASQVDPTGSSPVVAVLGSTVVIADFHGTSQGPKVGVYVGGALKVGSMRPTGTTYRVAASGTRITVAYTAYASNGTVSRVLERNGTTWSESSFSAPNPATVVGAGSYSGRGRVFFDTGSGRIVVRSQ